MYKKKIQYSRFNCTVPTNKIFIAEYFIETGQVSFLIKADQKNKLTSHIQDYPLYLSLQTTLASWCSALLASGHQSPSSCITSHCLKHPQQTHPHPFTNHYKNLIHSGIIGSPNRDPTRSVDTEPLKTRHPRRDDLRFVEHELPVRLFHFLSSPLFTI